MKKYLIAILGILLIAGLLGGIKALQIGKMIDQGKAFVPPPETVTTAVAQAQTWETTLSAVGSLRAVQGVTVAAELPGKVVEIAFAAGLPVKAGDLLIRQDTSTEQALLPGAEAAVALAETNLARARELLADEAVSQAEYDTALAGHSQALAQVENLRATIAKKTVRAPFAGRLGIRQVNLGQILSEGDEIVSLQALNPIFVDFLLPQQQLADLQKGLPVRLTSDAVPGRTIEGRITTISPEIDAATRNVRIQATVANPDELLRPGMYVNVAVVLPARAEVLAIPATAVLYAPYSDSVFVVEEQPATADRPAGKTLRQQFVRLGAKHGDFVAIESGLQPDETLVSTGVFKLRNGQAVVVDNQLSPEFQLQPQPADK